MGDVITNSYLKQLIQKTGVTSKNKMGETVMFDLIRHPNVTLESIKYLMSNGAKLDVINNNGENLLHLACKSEHINFDIIKFLINKEVKLTKQTKKVPFMKIGSHSTPILYLCKNPNITYDVLQYILDNNDSVSMNQPISEGAYETMFNKLCKNPGLTIELLQCAIKNGARVNYNRERTIKPIISLSENPNANANLFKCMIKNGAHINEDIAGDIIVNLCKTNKLNVALLKYIVKVSKTTVETITNQNSILSLLGGWSEELNYDLIKYLLKKGASIDPEMYRVNRKFLEYLIRYGNDKVLHAIADYDLCHKDMILMHLRSIPETTINSKDYIVY